MRLGNFVECRPFLGVTMMPHEREEFIPSLVAIIEGVARAGVPSLWW